jgi:hypothetical protein
MSLFLGTGIADGVILQEYAGQKRTVQETRFFYGNLTAFSLPIDQQLTSSTSQANGD